MSKLSLEFCMETGLPTGGIMKYNFLVNPYTSCKTDIVISTYTMQELVKEVTLKNHGLAILHGTKFSPYESYINPFSSDAYQSYITL